MQLSIPHKDSKEAAITKVKKMLADAKTQMGDQVQITKEEWQGDTLTFAFSAQGQNISGALTVEDQLYDINVKLPLMLRMFEGRIKSMVEEQSKQLLA